MIVLDNIFLLIQLLSCIAAIYFWKNYRHTSLWIFLPYLLYSFFNEVAVLVILKNFTFNTRILYNIYCVVSFCVYLYWFDKVLKLKSLKWVISLLFLGVILYDVYHGGIDRQLFKTAIFTQAILLIVFSFVYFARLLNKNEVINYQKIPEFWVIFGLLIFHIAFVPLSLVTGSGYQIQTAYFIAITILNCILYGAYIIGFYVAGK